MLFSCQKKPLLFDVNTDHVSDFLLGIADPQPGVLEYFCFSGFLFPHENTSLLMGSW